MPNIPTLTLALADADKDRLRWLAREWNLTIGRGPMADDGSISQIVASIATGDAAFFLISGDHEYDLADRLRELAGENTDVASVLLLVATALERAGHVYYNMPDAE